MPSRACPFSRPSLIISGGSLSLHQIAPAHQALWGSGSDIPSHTTSQLSRARPWWLCSLGDDTVLWTEMSLNTREKAARHPSVQNVPREAIRALIEQCLQLQLLIVWTLKLPSLNCMWTWWRGSWFGICEVPPHAPGSGRLHSAHFPLYLVIGQKCL